jgi:hypothetical protein
MVCSMKTTFDIPEPLLRDVQRLARERGTTTKSLVEQALAELVDAAASLPSYRLLDVSFGSGGVTVEFEHAGWEQFRAAIYDDRR